jgi:hypothetical protein
VLRTGLVIEHNGRLVLSQRGHEALSPLNDKVARALGIVVGREPDLKKKAAA